MLIRQRGPKGFIVAVRTDVAPHVIHAVVRSPPRLLNGMWLAMILRSADWPKRVGDDIGAEELRRLSPADFSAGGRKHIIAKARALHRKPTETRELHVGDSLRNSSSCSPGVCKHRSAVVAPGGCVDFEPRC